MRNSIVVVLLCAVAVAAWMLGRATRGNRPTALPGPVSTASEGAPAGSVQMTASTPVAVQPVLQTPVAPLHGQNTGPQPAESIESPVVATPFSRAIETLLSKEASMDQRQAAWRQLQGAGQLDEAIELLKRGAAEHPDSAAYPLALGQAQLQQAGVLSRNGGSLNEMGILAMQADQSFDAALKLDPANWEAQFSKASALAHWPQELNKGDEVIQRLSSLIDQQETMLPQPHFAQAYLVLGDQYLKLGYAEHAVATWQIGAQKFPGDLMLAQRIRDH